MLRHPWNVLSVFTVAVFVAAALTFACADDDDTSPTAPVDPDDHEEEEVDHGPGEEELITTLGITFTPASGGSPVTASFRDLDGEGGNAPVVDDITLSKGTTYNGVIEVLNETESPAEDITEEVKEESEAHQFFFVPSGGIASATVMYLDKESDYGTNTGADHPVGVRFSIEIPQAATDGKLRVLLSHFDDAPKDGETPSDETDIDVTFNVIVE